MCKFFSHRERAERHNIEFIFTKPQWVAWWIKQLGPDWGTKRGPKPHQYCMARFNDQGPYAVWNVKCITNAENRAEQRPPSAGEKNGHAKLTKEQALLIRDSSEPRKKLAVIFGVSVPTICRVQNKNTWSGKGG